MTLSLNTWYSKTGTNVINTNTAGINYRVTRTTAQELANQSRIEIKPWIKKTVSLGAYDLNNATMTIKCAGQTKTSVIDYDLYHEGSANTKYYLTSSLPFRRISGSSSPYTYIVSHNTDGTLSSVNLYAYIPLANSGSGENHVVNINVGLPTIPRGSILKSIPSFTYDSTAGNGVAFSVPCTKYSDAFYDVLTIKIGSNTIATREDYESGTVTLSGSEVTTAYSKMTTSNSATFTFELRTYSNSAKTTQIGSTSTKTATGAISSTGRAPTFAAGNITYADADTAIAALTGNNRTIVKGYSNPAISINTKASANKGASLGDNCYTFAISGKANQYANQTDSAPITKTFTNVSSNQFTVSVADSRGNSTSNTKTYSTYIGYSAPIITSVKLKRDNNVETRTKIEISGQIWNGNFGAATNAIEALAYQYKETGASSYTSGTTNLFSEVTYNSSTGKFNLTTATYINGDEGTGGTNGFDSNQSYDIRVTVADKIRNYSYNAVLSEGIPGTYLKKFYSSGDFDGYGFGVEKKPETGRSIDALRAIYANDGEKVLTEADEYRGDLPNGDILNGSYIRALKTGIYWYGNTGTVSNVPATWGIVQVIKNAANGTEVRILWYRQSTGEIYHLGVNANSTTAYWRRTIDDAWLHRELWSGSWSSGNITCDVGDYTVFKITVNNTSSALLCVKNGTVIAGSNATSGTDWAVLRNIWISISGTTLTLNACRSVQVYGSGGITNESVTGLWGII